MRFSCLRSMLASRKRRAHTTAAMLAFTLLAAAAMSPAEPPPQKSSSQPGSDAAATGGPRVSPATHLPGRVPPPAEEVVVAGEVPDELVAKLRTDLAKRIGDASAAASARIVRAEAVNWPNGALGCPKPGQMYTQAIVPGYRVDFDVAGKVHSYHAATRGFFTLCEPLSAAKAPSLPR